MKRNPWNDSGLNAKLKTPDFTTHTICVTQIFAQSNNKSHAFPPTRFTFPSLEEGYMSGENANFLSILFSKGPELFHFDYRDNHFFLPFGEDVPNRTNPPDPAPKHSPTTSTRAAPTC